MKNRPRSKRFWAIIFTIAIMSILSALENTAVITALPYIATQLDLGENYIWVTNAFFLTVYGISESGLRDWHMANFCRL